MFNESRNIVALGKTGGGGGTGGVGGSRCCAPCVAKTPLRTSALHTTALVCLTVPGQSSVTTQVH